MNLTDYEREMSRLKAAEQRIRQVNDAIVELRITGVDRLTPMIAGDSRTPEPERPVGRFQNLDWPS
jgi:hypothetical protein